MRLNFPAFLISELVLRRIVLVLFLTDYIIRGLSGVWLHHFAGIPFSLAGTDGFYWIIHLLHFPQWILGQYFLLWIADILLLVLPVILLFVYKRVLMVTTLFLLILYYVVSNSAFGSHYYSLNGFIFLFLWLCFHHSSYSGITYQGIRYYNLYIYACAGLWKACRGLWSYHGQLTNIIVQDNFMVDADTNTTWYGSVYRLLVSNSEVGDWLLRVAMLLQLSTITGFLTTKHDKLLFVIVMCFHIGNYLTMRVFSFEIAVLSLTLLFSISPKPQNALP